MCVLLQQSDIEFEKNNKYIIVTGVLCNIDRLELIMPRYALKGGDVTLKCDHSVRLEHLHKVEWKKGEDKLFMYVKGRTPPFKAWAIPGAKLNVSIVTILFSYFKFLNRGDIFAAIK